MTPHDTSPDIPLWGTIGSRAGATQLPPLPCLEPAAPDATYAVLCDVAGWRWKVIDVRAHEVPLVARRPGDPEATHRVFRSEHGVRCRAPLADVERGLPNFRRDDAGVSALQRSLTWALNYTLGAREAHAEACRAHLRALRGRTV